MAAQQEDQLKPPTGNLLSAFGEEFGLKVVPRLESPVEGIGRPDIALDVDGLLCGYVELKAPEVNIRNLKGRDKEQFKKFSSLPNLIYTNGNDWILYRDKTAVTRHRLSDDIMEDGADAVDERDAEKLSAMLRDFLTWGPIVPNSPKALAESLAPPCHLLRDDVTQALEDPESAISYLPPLYAAKEADRPGNHIPDRAHETLYGTGVDKLRRRVGGHPTRVFARMVSRRTIVLLIHSHHQLLLYAL